MELAVETVLALPSRMEVFCFPEIGAFQVEAPASARARYGWVCSWRGASSGDSLAAVVALDVWDYALWRSRGGELRRQWAPGGCLRGRRRGAAGYGWRGRWGRIATARAAPQVHPGICPSVGQEGAAAVDPVVAAAAHIGVGSHPRAADSTGKSRAGIGFCAASDEEDLD